MNAQAQYYVLEALIVYVIASLPLVVGTVLFIWQLLRSHARIEADRDHWQEVAANASVIARSRQQQPDDDDENDTEWGDDERGG
jgi:hypothetical protein